MDLEYITNCHVATASNNLAFPGNRYIIVGLTEENSSLKQHISQAITESGEDALAEGSVTAMCLPATDITIDNRCHNQ